MFKKPHISYWRGKNLSESHKLSCSLAKRGEKSVTAKLTTKKVKYIRSLKIKDPEITYYKLGKMFGVAASTIRLIILNRTWKI